MFLFFFFKIFLPFHIQSFAVFHVGIGTKGYIFVGQINGNPINFEIFWRINCCLATPWCFPCFWARGRCHASPGGSPRRSYGRELLSIVPLPVVYFLVTGRFLYILTQLVVGCPFPLLTLLSLQPFSGQLCPLASLCFSFHSSSSAFSSLTAAPSPPSHHSRTWVLLGYGMWEGGGVGLDTWCAYVL